MFFLNPNYTYLNYQQDLAKLKQFWKKRSIDSDDEESDFFSQEIFIISNNAYSFYLYYHCKNIFREGELTFDPFVFDMKTYGPRRHENLISFKNVLALDLLDGYDYIRKIWFTYGIDAEKCFLSGEFQELMTNLKNCRLILST